MNEDIYPIHTVVLMNKSNKSIHETIVVIRSEASYFYFLGHVWGRWEMHIKF